VRARRVHVPRSLIRAAGRGTAATAVMSVPMLVRSALQPTPPPPQVVTENLQRRVGLEPTRYPRPLRHVVWGLAHLGFGTTLGLVAAAWPHQARTRRSAYAFGAAVWAANYGVGLPAIGLYPRLGADDRLRAAESFVSHLVYAAALRRVGPQP